MEKEKPAIVRMAGTNQAHERMMAHAVGLAENAYEMGETPIGALIVRNEAILGRGFNQVEALHDPTAHAEILALRESTQSVGDWRLPGTTMYVTVEPCIMCAAALIHARVEKVVFGAMDHRWGGLGSLFDLSHDPRVNHELEVISGVMEEEAARLLQKFFREVRKRKINLT